MKRKISTCSRSSSSDSSSSGSSSSSSDSSSEDEKNIKEKISKRKLKKIKKKAKKKEKKRVKKMLKKKIKKLKKAKKELKKREKLSMKRTNSFEGSSNSNNLDVSACTIDAADLEKSKARAPMTKEEWEKQQSVIQRVYDPDTGRNRLVKGDGEIIEECVSRERHIAINKAATKGDGEFFQSTILSKVKKI